MRKLCASLKRACPGGSGQRFDYAVHRATGPGSARRASGKRTEAEFGCGPAVSIQVNPLTAFGLFAVTAMLVCYALEQRSRWFILGFAGACALGSAYGFLQGAWPFGLVEAIWSFVAARRWWFAH